MKLRVLVKFQDIKKPDKIYKPGDVVEITDNDRAESLISRKLCEAVDGDDDNANGVVFNEKEFELKAVKEALKTIDAAVANNAGVAAVTKKLAELTVEQVQALSEILA